MAYLLEIKCEKNPWLDFLLKLKIKREHVVSNIKGRIYRAY